MQQIVITQRLFFSQIDELAKYNAHPIYLKDYASADKNPRPAGF